MERPSRFSPELKERAVRMVREHAAETPPRAASHRPGLRPASVRHLRRNSTAGHRPDCAWESCSCSPGLELCGSLRLLLQLLPVLLFVFRRVLLLTLFLILLAALVSHDTPPTPIVRQQSSRSEPIVRMSGEECAAAASPDEHRHHGARMHGRAGGPPRRRNGSLRNIRFSRPV
jgi:hypothetical protein